MQNTLSIFHVKLCLKSHINLSYILGKIDEEYSFLILSSCLLSLT